MSDTIASTREPFQRIRLRVMVSPMPPNPDPCQGEIKLVIGRHEEGVPGTPLSDGGLAFDWEVRVRWDPKIGRPRFGSEVSGKPDEPHLYLAWKSLKDGEWTLFRGIKIHLRTITWDQILRVLEKGGHLEAQISGVGPKGSPACASVPLIGGGWTVVPAGPREREGHGNGAPVNGVNVG